MRCYVNDGKSLAMVEDRSVDFAFSFDSLVHVEADVIAAYLNQLGKKLKPGGFTFLHHSNLESYRKSIWLPKAIGRPQPIGADGRQDGTDVAESVATTAAAIEVDRLGPRQHLRQPRRIDERQDIPGIMRRRRARLQVAGTGQLESRSIADRLLFRGDAARREFTQAIAAAQESSFHG